MKSYTLIFIILFCILVGMLLSLFLLSLGNYNENRIVVIDPNNQANILIKNTTL